ncbi:MAG: DUF4421 domain-containing protein, partial [Muribaculaceae bacterium]|nr:DUF4421 domain-containing protein [Muribaculaceae bacterium]
MSRTHSNPRHILSFFLIMEMLLGGFSAYSDALPEPDMQFVSTSSAVASEIVNDPMMNPDAVIEDLYETEFYTPGDDSDDEPILRPALPPRPEAPDPNRNWWHLFKKGKLNMADTTVQYPKFLDFCVKVYRWADKAFNSYDPQYVEGTGRRWKARILSDNWVDSYYINPGKKIPVRMMSEPYTNIGAYIQYMAVSIGYSVDMNKLIGKHPSNHQKLEYTFNCARFNIEGHIWTNTGGTYIRTFGDYNNGHLIKEFFDGVKLKNIETYGYYFFNNRKFSMGAAYNFSKFQLKSAGSAVIGLGYNNLDVTIDLTKLPETLIPYLNVPPENYRFHYRSYALIGGYSFNWVITPRLLFNISAMPGVGVNKTYADNYSGSSYSTAVNLRAMGSLTYNLKDFFICAVAKLYGSFYTSDNNSLFSSVENGQVSIG